VLVDLKLTDFIESVAAKTPTPGGGAVAAAACALGSALGVMAARFSAGPESLAAAGSLEEMKVAFVPMVDQDAEAYDAVSTAFGLPKGTDEEKRRRKEAIQRALKDAAEVPLKVCLTAVRALELLVDLAPHCNKNLVSDLASGAIMLSAGLESASHNVRINASMLVDKEVAARLTAEDARLTARGAELRKQVLKEAERLQKASK
jgi:formiminotetrahydrofolate cyclodeaminase